MELISVLLLPKTLMKFGKIKVPNVTAAADKTIENVWYGNGLFVSFI
jgi:hypothetical protein